MVVALAASVTGAHTHARVGPDAPAGPASVAEAKPASPAADEGPLATADPAPAATRVVRVVPQTAPDLEIAEPWYGGVADSEVRAASLAMGLPVGGHLDPLEADARVTAAAADASIALAAAGMDSSGSLADDLHRAADAFGLEADPASPPPMGALVAAVTERLGPWVRLLGEEPGAAVDDGHVRAALHRVGHDVGETVDAEDVIALESYAASIAAPLIVSTRHHPGERIGSDDLDAMVRAVGHDPGATTDAADVAAALARAGDLRVGPAGEISPGLSLRRVAAQLGGGPVVGHLLAWRLDDARVAVRTEHTGSHVGRAGIPAVAAARPGAVAAVNGGFWLGAADPDGLLVTDGRLLSDPAMLRTWVRGRRGGFVLLDGGAAVGAPDWRAEVTGADPAAGSTSVRGVNRAIRTNEVVVFTEGWRPTTGTPPGTFEVTLDVSSPLTNSGVMSGRVIAVGMNGDAPIAPGTTVIAASGEERERLYRLGLGGTLELHVEVPAPWEGARQGLTGGPLMMTAGQPTSTDDWRREGFAASHTDRRHPRTMFGLDGAGHAYVLVLDGRQPGYSVGATQAEATLLARALGMLDAVMLDGGGSSHLVVHGATANRPCCDATPRPVTTAITFHPTT